MLTKYDTVCLGDSGNDIAMMSGAKFSFCIGERCPELATACTNKAQNAEIALDFCINNIKTTQNNNLF